MSDYTILLIDYDPRSIEHIRGLLSAAGHRVEVAKNGLAGLESFREHEPSLVLVEAMLPKKHGFEVCQEIKDSEHGPSTSTSATSISRSRSRTTSWSRSWTASSGGPRAAPTPLEHPNTRNPSRP